MSSSNIRLVERLRDRVQASDFSRGGVVEYGLVSDFFEMIRICEEENAYFAHELNREVRDICSRSVHNRELSLSDREKFYFLNKRALLFDALEDFDAYIQYLEYDRPAEKKFYLPRRKVLYPIVKDMEALDRRELDFLSVSLPPRVGKLVSDDTPVLTRDGWKNHGGLVVGDEVISPRGDFVCVTHVFPKNVANVRVNFTDGTYVDVHENHEWVVYNRHRHKVEVLETKEMVHDYETGIPGKRGHRYHYQVPIKNFVEGEHKKLPVEPYTLGAWLGDGRNGNADICGNKEDYPIVEGIIADGYPVSWHTTHKTTGVEYFGFKGLRKGLQKLGMCHSRKRKEKRIPQEYLTAGVYQRMQLLAGLLDTDGCLRTKENRYDFTTADEKLKEDFVSLVSTFGWRCSIKGVEPHTSSSGIIGRRKYWTVSFNPTCFIPCRLERKQLKKFSKPRRIAICGFEKIEPKPGNCISVEGGIYCVGKRLTPTHNSTLGIFFMTWLMGKYPDKSNLMSGHSDILTNGFYKEVLSILTDPQYLWGDIFQGYKITQSALYQTVDVNDGKRRFPTLTCRSIGGTLTGAVEFSKCLYCDDLIRDLEEALSPTRLESKYNNYANLLKDRKVEDGFQLMIGTRWAPNDVQGRIEEQYKDNPRYRFRVIPALDENGESNFQYEQGHGFSTAYYMDMKESIDNATWTAKYMGNPYEREGLLFPTDELNFYNGVLPGTEPDKIVAFCDVAWGGGDSLAMPFAYVYGEDVYIHDVIFNRGDKEQTRPIVVGKIMQHTPHQARFEANNGGDEYCDAVDALLREKGVKLNLSHRKAPGNMNKIARIVQKSPEIKRMHFLDFKNSNSEYRAFMRELTTFVTTGKNKHDDAPDALAGLATLIDSDAGSIKVFKRPF